MSAVSLGGLEYQVMVSLEKAKQDLDQFEQDVASKGGITIGLNQAALKQSWDEFLSSIEGSTVNVRVNYVSENGPSGQNGFGSGIGSTDNIAAILIGQASVSSDVQQLGRGESGGSSFASVGGGTSQFYEENIGVGGGYRDPVTGRFMTRNSAVTTADDIDAIRGMSRQAAMENAERIAATESVEAEVGTQAYADQNMSINAALYRDKAAALGIPLREISRAENPEDISNAFAAFYGIDPEAARRGMGGIVQSISARGQSPFVAEAMRSAAGGEENMDIGMRRMGAPSEYTRQFDVGGESYEFFGNRNTLDPEDDDFNKWHIGFRNLSNPGNEFGVTGTQGYRGAVQVLRQARQNLNEFIASENPDYVGFSARGESRANLYGRMGPELEGAGYIASPPDIDYPEGEYRSYFGYTRRDAAEASGAPSDPIGPNGPNGPLYGPGREEYGQELSRRDEFYAQRDADTALRSRAMRMGRGIERDAEGNLGLAAKGDEDYESGGGGNEGIGGSGIGNYMGRHLAMLGAYEAVRMAVDTGNQVAEYNQIVDQSGIDSVKQQQQALENLQKQNSGVTGLLRRSAYSGWNSLVELRDSADEMWDSVTGEYHIKDLTNQATTPDQEIEDARHKLADAENQKKQTDMARAITKLSKSLGYEDLGGGLNFAHGTLQKLDYELGESAINPNDHLAREINRLEHEKDDSLKSLAIAENILKQQPGGENAEQKAGYARAIADVEGRYGNEEADARRENANSNYITNQQLRNQINETRDATSRILKGDKLGREEDEVEHIGNQFQLRIQADLLKKTSQGDIQAGEEKELGVATLEKYRAHLTSTLGTKEIDPLYSNTSGGGDLNGLLQQILLAIQAIKNTGIPQTAGN
jgi:hypothetical protein